MKSALLATVLFAITSLSYSQNFIDDKAEIDIILNNIDKFSEHVMSSNYEGISSSYTADGKIMPSGPEIIEGREDIKARWTLPEGVAITYHKIMPEEIKIIGDHAYDYGYYEGTTKRKDDSEVSWKGKYVIVWKKIDGDWLIYLDIWNSVDPNK